MEIDDMKVDKQVNFVLNNWQGNRLFLFKETFAVENNNDNVNRVLDSVAERDNNDIVYFELT
jgi:hypothetical protein